MDLTVLPAQCTLTRLFTSGMNLPLPSKSDLVLIYRPWRHGWLSSTAGCKQSVQDSYEADIAVVSLVIKNRHASLGKQAHSVCPQLLPGARGKA